MQALSAADVLEIWEWGRARPPLRRPLCLLAAAHPGADAEALAGLSIGQRDAGLLALREQLFGQRLECLGACPECDEPVELSFDAADIRVAPLSRPWIPAPQGADEMETISLSVAGYNVHFRVPNSRDLAAVAQAGAGADARQRLLACCILLVERDGRPQAVNTLPEQLVAAVAARMAEADPQADVTLSLTCPECAHSWRASFDIASFLWAEIETWAQRILGDVHSLAAAYGWSERDILALSPVRRQYYLDMARG